MNRIGFSCLSCVYFSQYLPFGGIRPAPRGQCRRHAPTLYQDAEGFLKTAWPMVHEDGYCGEHAQIAEPEEPEIEPQPRVESIKIAEQTIEPPPDAYHGPEWRCINCKTVEQGPTMPERCYVCRCKEFERFEV